VETLADEDDGDSARAEPADDRLDVAVAIGHNMIRVFVVIATTRENDDARSVRDSRIEAAQHSVGRIPVDSLIGHAQIGAVLTQQGLKLGGPGVRQWQQISPRGARAQGDNLRFGFCDSEKRQSHDQSQPTHVAPAIHTKTI